MRIQLAYGRDGASIDVPDENLVAVVEPDWPAALEPAEAAVAKALRAPVAGPSLAAVLAERTKGRSRSVGTKEWHRDWHNFRAVVLVSDRTRSAFRVYAVHRGLGLRRATTCHITTDRNHTAQRALKAPLRNSVLAVRSLNKELTRNALRRQVSLLATGARRPLEYCS